MKCKRVDCFAYNPVLHNNCRALVDIRKCNFYKPSEQLRREEEELKAAGKPWFEPSVTRNEQRILKEKLSNARTEYMDQTGQKHS